MRKIQMIDAFSRGCLWVTFWLSKSAVITGFWSEILSGRRP